MPVIVPNFIVLARTVYEKSITIFLHSSLFGAPGGLLGPKFTNLGGDV